MRAAVFILMFVLSVATRAGTTESAYAGADLELLAQVRTDFGQAPESAAVTRKLLRLLAASLPRDRTTWPPVFQAFQAALEVMMGKHSLTPWQKYGQVKAGLAAFRGLAEAHPQSIEIRMLRYASYEQLPEFFGTHDDAETDLAALVDLLERNADPMIPAAPRQAYVHWILDHGRPGPALKDRLEKIRAP